MLTLVIILLLLAAPPAQLKPGTRPNTVAPARPADTIQPLEANEFIITPRRRKWKVCDTLIKRRTGGQAVQQNLEQHFKIRVKTGKCESNAGPRTPKKPSLSCSIGEKSLRQEMATRSANRFRHCSKSI